ncbi:MAG: sigma-70 family RNA polymerase sigma factor [Planctomycetota bacterium]
MDDSRLVEMLIKGSDEAFAALYDTYGSRIFSVVYRIVGDSTESEDVVQEVFLKVLRNIASFNQQSSLYTWLYRIAANAAVDAKKRFGPQHMMSIYKKDGQAFDLESDAENPESVPQREEMAGILREAMDQLSDDHRTILVLREFENMSYSDIAKVLNCSKGTVESRLFRARNRLREKLEKYV